MGSLTPVTIAKYLDLWEATEYISLNDQPDRTVWRWCQVRLQNDARGLRSIPGALANMGDMDAVEGKNLPLAHLHETTLDERPACKARSRSKGRVLPLRSSAGDDRPHLV